MSKTAAILIHTSIVTIDVKVYKDIVDALFQNGWDIDRNNGIIFMQNGTYDFEKAAVQDFDYVIALIANSIVNKKESFIKLIRDEYIGIEVTYLNSSLIMFSLTDEIANLSNISIPDFSYYIEHLSSVFSIVDFNRIECIYD